MKNCNDYKKYKYIYTLLCPEDSRGCRVPDKFGTPTTIFKRKRQLELFTSTASQICIDWPCQAFYQSNTGIYVYQNSGYNGQNITTPTTFGFGTDNSGFLPNKSPVRLVAASLRVLYTGSTANQGVFTGAIYNTSIHSGTYDTNMSLLRNIVSLEKNKTYPTKSGIKIIYSPTDISCYQFYQSNSDIGSNQTDGDPKITQRILFHAMDVDLNTSCITAIFTQIFESTHSNDYLCPLADILLWNPSDWIDKFINSKNRNIHSGWEESKIKEELCISNDDDNEDCELSFFNLEKYNGYRLPSIFGQETCVFKQKQKFLISTNNLGNFCLLFYPQIFHTLTNSSNTGLYIANNVNFDGKTNVILSELTNMSFQNYSNPVFDAVRLVGCTIKIRNIGKNSSTQGMLIGGINLENPTFSILSDLNSRFDYSRIESFLVNKSVYPYEGLKMIFTPFDYSCFNFLPPDYVSGSKLDNPTLLLGYYICGLGLLQSTSCISIEIIRCFEGIPTTYFGDYYTLDKSKVTLEKCGNMSSEILNTNSMITKLIDEKNIKL